MKKLLAVFALLLISAGAFADTYTINTLVLPANRADGVFDRLTIAGAANLGALEIGNRGYLDTDPSHTLEPVVFINQSQTVDIAGNWTVQAAGAFIVDGTLRITAPPVINSDPWAITIPSDVIFNNIFVNRRKSLSISGFLSATNVYAGSLLSGGDISDTASSYGAIVGASVPPKVAYGVNYLEGGTLILRNSVSPSVNIFNNAKMNGSYGFYAKWENVSSAASTSYVYGAWESTNKLTADTCNGNKTATYTCCTNSSAPNPCIDIMTYTTPDYYSPGNDFLITEVRGRRECTLRFSNVGGTTLPDCAMPTNQNGQPVYNFRYYQTPAEVFGPDAGNFPMPGENDNILPPCTYLSSGGATKPITGSDVEQVLNSTRRGGTVSIGGLCNKICNGGCLGPTNCYVADDIINRRLGVRSGMNENTGLDGTNDPETLYTGVQRGHSITGSGGVACAPTQWLVNDGRFNGVGSGLECTNAYEEVTVRVITCGAGAGDNLAGGTVYQKREVKCGTCGGVVNPKDEKSVEAPGGSEPGNPKGNELNLDGGTMLGLEANQNPVGDKGVDNPVDKGVDIGGGTTEPGTPEQPTSVVGTYLILGFTPSLDDIAIKEYEELYGYEAFK